ncbi:MAG: Flp family type IVb pilin [Myxococcaceae bacterium]
MQPTSRRRFRNARGQGMTEYIIIVALIAVAAIGVVNLFGDNLRKLFGMSADALAGQNDIQMRGERSRQELEGKTLQSFGQNSH